jgi:hypothetical protein
MVSGLVATMDNVSVLRCQTDPGNPIHVPMNRVIQLSRNSIDETQKHRFSCTGLNGKNVCTVELDQASSIASLLNRIAIEIGTERLDLVLSNGTLLHTWDPSTKVKDL